MQIRVLFVLFCVFLFGFKHSITSQDCPFTISVPQDVTICDESFVLLDGDIVGPYLNFEWSSNYGYFQTSNLNPTVWVDRNTTFTLTAFSLPTQNLINNGDFSLGNTGFTTQYLYMPDIPGIQNELVNEGTYSVHTNPNELHSNFANCQDQSGDGNMMILNGGGSFQQVWCQNVSINPNTSYIFSAWATSVISASPAILQFSINGTLIGNPLSLSSSVCNWQEFFATWNSGANTTAQICIVNNNTALSGNDFAIDNIFFGPLCEEELSFDVTIETFEILDFQPSVIDCNNPTSEIRAFVSPNLNFDYLWSTTYGTIVSNIDSPDIVVSASGDYTVTVTSSNGCTVERTFYVDTDTTNPDIFVEGNLELDCLNNSTILTGYTSVFNSQIFWQRPNGAIDYGSAISVSSPGIYTVVVTGPNGCVTEEEVEVLLNIPNLIYDTTTDSLTCTKESALITVRIITPIDSIVWESNNIIHSSSSKDSITVGAQGAYYFTLFLGGNCRFTDSIIVEQIPPNFSYEWPNFDTLDCNNNEMVLFLSNPQNIANILWEDSSKNLLSMDTLRIETSGQYNVTITDLNGCSVLDSVTVIGDFDLPQFEVTLDSIDCINNFGKFYANIPDGSKILWQGPGLYTTNPTPIIDVSGDYSLMVTGENGCISSQVFSMPTSQNFPVISYNISHIDCLNPDGRIELDVNIPAQIFWISPDSIMGTDSVIISPTSGEFFIEAVTNKGCKDSIWIRLDVDTLAPMLSIISNEILTCTNETIVPTVIASDYTSFVWTGPNGDSLMDLSPMISAPGEYFLTLTNDVNGCITEQSFVVEQDIEKPSLSVEYQDLDCNNPVTILNILSPNANQFFVNGNLSGANSYIVSTPGAYIIIARGTNGCDSIINIEINGFFDAHQAELPEISLNCFKDSVWLVDSNYNSDVIYNWVVDGNMLTEDSLLVQVSTNGFLETTNIYGCKSVFPLIIQSDFEKPLLEIDGPKMIGCKEESISLIAMSSSENIVYSWWTQGQALSEQSSIQIDTSGIFALVGLNPVNGCFSQIEIEISKEVGPEYVELDVIQPLCFGENGRVVVQNVTGGTAPYSILVNSQMRNVNGPMILGPGVYNLEILDAKGCDLKTEIWIDQPEDFQISAGDDIEMNLGDNVILQGTSTLQFSNIKNIDWTPASSLNCSDCLQPIASPTSDTEYELIVTDMNGCTKEDQVIVRVKILKGYTAPNVFYPNSTAGNNAFTIYSLFKSIRSIKTLNIYDRWGNNVFSVQNSLPDDISLGWNGLHGGRYAEPGVFVWVAELEYIDNSLEIVVGDITVLR